MIWGWLNSVFNRPDPERIKEVGAERACAEWLLRCGAHVKWQGSEKWQTDYNKLPASNFSKYVIEEINANEAAVMSLGFPHFDGVKHVKKIDFQKCPYLEDESLHELSRLKDSLEHLMIGSCGEVTDKGLMSLANLTRLKTLVLYNLPSIQNKENCYQGLKKSLPACQIDYSDIEQNKTET